MSEASSSLSVTTVHSSSSSVNLAFTSDDVPFTSLPVTTGRGIVPNNCAFCQTCQFSPEVKLQVPAGSPGTWFYTQAGGTIWCNLYLSASFHRIPPFLQYSCCDMHLSSKTPSGAISSCQHLEYSTPPQHSCSPKTLLVQLVLLSAFFDVSPLWQLSWQLLSLSGMSRMSRFSPTVLCLTTSKHFVWYEELTGYLLVIAKKSR